MDLTLLDGARRVDDNCLPITKAIAVTIRVKVSVIATLGRYCCEILSQWLAFCYLSYLFAASQNTDNA
jgi:hypothetical protein